MREVVAGVGAHEGHVGCVWDGGSTGWQRHIERGLGMSEAPVRVQRNGARPGWSWGDSLRITICGAVRLDAGVVKKMHGWGQDACT